jgi:hypothetical protein
MRWAFTYFLVAVVMLCLITVVVRLANGQPLPSHWLAEPVSLLATLFTIVVGMGIAIFLLMFLLGAVVTPEALYASTYWGRRQRVPWSDIATVSVGSYEGLPALIVRAEAMEAELYVYTLGLNRQEAHRALRSTAGPDHVLTRCFAEDA